MTLQLQPNITLGAEVTRIASDAWHLEIPPGLTGQYRLAQLDDYHRLPRRAFPWHPPLSLSLQARASHKSIPGTWGFGLWNDPFGLAFLRGGGVRLPALPNAAWFFFASPPNYLSLRDDLPAQGALAATFQSPGWSSILFLPTILLTPLLLIRPVVRGVRRLVSRVVQQDAVALPIDPMERHAYRIDWSTDRTIFYMDGKLVLETTVVPGGPLGLVMWVDNQYAALPPDGRMGYGTLPDPQPAWIEVDDLMINQSGAAIAPPQQNEPNSPII